MIDALFGSKTRVKLLHLFLNNPDKAFYVREITRIINEQINSVRRELANMLSIGIITSDSADNKLYYQVNKQYEYYKPLKNIFGDAEAETVVKEEAAVAPESGINKLKLINGAKLIVVAGSLVKGSKSEVDLLIAGTVNTVRAKSFISDIEKQESVDIRYSIIPYEEFYYRLSVRDRFITEIINDKHVVLVDTDQILK